MATGPDLSSSSPPAAVAAAATKKDRHIVSWSAEEDDLLRAQIAHHGTDNWTIIATQFKDKTARQCRRRWYNYLNTECKKGGWSSEEDVLLCQAQKLLGNKWTEIAKVVSGRTDNAVKNRFSTLCKKRGKDEDPFKENDGPCSDPNAKRVLTTHTGCVTSGVAGSSPPNKQMRSCTTTFKENIKPNMRLFVQKIGTGQDPRQPLAIISPENNCSVNILENQHFVTKMSSKQLYGAEQHVSGVKHEGNFLKKDDPKFTTLLQQADLLCSLATKLNTENTSKSMDEAWQQLQQHLVKKEDNAMSESSMSGTASLLEELDALIVDPYENEEEEEQKSREQNGEIDVDDKHFKCSSQTSMQITPQMDPDQEIDNFPVDKSTEGSSLCRGISSSCMESCPEIPASVNLSESAEDCKLCCMYYTSPAHTILQAEEDTEIPTSSINLSEAAEGCKLCCMDYTSPSHTILQVEEDTEIPTASINLSEAAEGSWLQCMEYMSPAHTVLQAEADSEIPALVNLSEAAMQDSSLQCAEFTSPAHRVLQPKEDAQTPSSDNFSKKSEHSRLEHVEFTSPAHTSTEDIAGLDILENCSKDANDSSKLPFMEFASPALTVPSFQPYPDGMPTPKITASEKNFLLSVLELTSPGSKPDTSQQPSCKRALLHSL